jgi:adenylate cyclase
MSAVEVERKFLVWEVPADLNAHPASPISQGYLAIEPDGSEVRLRRRAEHTSLTVKRGHGRVRREEEIDVTPSQFEALWPLTEGRRLEKTRYEISAGDGLTIELDVYGGALAGLVTAEVEFERRADADGYLAPPWLGPEVTDDDAYKNQRLATDGLPFTDQPPADA